MPVVVIDTGVVTRPVADANGASEFSEGLDVDKDSGRCTSSRRWRPRADEDFDASLIDDADGHGTTVASLAVGPANGVYTVGVAPNATLLVLKVADDRRHLDNLSAVLRACALPRAANAIAAAGGAGVINISLGLSASDRETAAMIAPVVRAGALVVAAAGHPGGAVAQPARASHVLAVGVPAAGWPALVDVVAPGAGPGVRVVRSTGAYESVSPAEPGDTSWASAVSGGAAAYLLSRTPGTAQQIAWRLRLGASGMRSAPMIDLRRAVAMVAPADDEIEPNDSIALATRTFAIDGALGTPWTGQCRTRRCDSFAGIASRNDDPVDVWVVRTPRGAGSARRSRRAAARSARRSRASGRGASRSGSPPARASPPTTCALASAQASPG